MKQLKLYLIWIKALFTFINGKKLTFKNVSNNWYYDFPGWPFEESTLRIDGGFDTILNAIAKNKKSISFILHKQQYSPNDIHLTKIKSSILDGGDYVVNVVSSKATAIWVSPILIFIIGTYPDELFLQQSS